MLKIQSRLLQSMTCKDAINSDETQRKSVEEKRYPLSENKRYNKIFEFDLQGSNNISDIEETVRSIS